jgi:C-terminal processing protease CtpA/Prc
MRRPGSLFSLAVLLFLALPLRAHDMPSGNLAALGRIWGIVNYAHPWLGYRDIAFEEATLAAIHDVRLNPSSHSTLSRAVGELLAVLGDEATHVRRPCSESVGAAAVDRSTRLLSDGVVYISAAMTPDAATINALRGARGAVVDLRPQPGRCTPPALSEELASMLFRGSVARASHRKVRHHGYRSQNPESDPGGFQSAFTTIVTGDEQGSAEAAMGKVVFLVDERSVIPPVAAALAAAEKAAFVSAGPFPLHSVVDHCQIALGDGSIITLRTSELVDGEGFPAEPAAMMSFAADTPDATLVAAAQQVARPRMTRRRASGSRVTALPDYEWRADRAYASTELPSPEHRILAAFRIWNVIEFFYGYPHLVEAWDEQFTPILEKLEHVQTRAEYELALAEVMTLVRDGGSLVESPAYLALRGTASAPFTLLPVEGKPVVVDAATSGVGKGDELLRIDGRDAGERLAALEKAVPASTEVMAKVSAIRALADGVPGTTATFTFRRPDGTTYDVALLRGTQTVPEPAKAWRMLENGIAYVDLRFLDAEEVPAMFEEIGNTRALILDLRNGTRAGYAELASRMNTTALTVASQIRVPQLIGGARNASSRSEDLGSSEVAQYRGRTVALVDERTQGGAEHAALALESLAGTEFVGSPTAGAIGAVTTMVVPGGIHIRFTGTDVRHADGRQLHQVGIVPDELVPRTIRALSEGRDEGLERAIRFVDEVE